MKRLRLRFQSTFEGNLGEECFLHFMSLNYSLFQRKEQLKKKREEQIQREINQIQKDAPKYPNLKGNVLSNLVFAAGSCQVP